MCCCKKQRTIVLWRGYWQYCLTLQGYTGLDHYTYSLCHHNNRVSPTVYFLHVSSSNNSFPWRCFVWGSYSGRCWLLSFEEMTSFLSWWLCSAVCLLKMGSFSGFVISTPIKVKFGGQFSGQFASKNRFFKNKSLKRLKQWPHLQL